MAEITIKWQNSAFVDSVWEGIPETCAEAVTDLLNALEDAHEADLPQEVIAPFLKGVELIATDIYLAIRAARSS